MALAAFPAASFPGALGDGAALEAAYRFLGNAEVDATDVLAPHRRETVARCAERQTVIVAHDTTDFVFPGEKRRGLGRMRGRLERGFFAHVALAVSWDASREPLGVLHLETWTRGPKPRKAAKKNPRDRQRDSNRESMRWARGVETVESQLDAVQAIHVMDREADAYDLIAALVGDRRRFIIRSTFDRRVAEGENLDAAVASQPVVVTREVPLSERRGSVFPKQRKIHPPRSARTATLGIKAAAVTLLRPRDLTGLPTTLAVHVVLVEEMNPPEGEPAVTWRLYTTEPIDTPADIERIVDGYRCRWRDEEFFKALKTGCAIEKRQLESCHALVNALAVYIPIAWRVLRHRTLAHTDGKASASTILTTLQIRILRRLSKMKLPRTISIADALAAVAALGGHLRRNGPPGWITLARGYERLLTLEEGALLAEEM